ncbi:MAG: hypothetical protein AAGI70_14015 [Pseudomonadota bacterium]
MPYRLSVSHPALPEPETARGTLEAQPDGTLIRAQTFPEIHRAEIGRDVIWVFDGEGERELFPISAEMRPVVVALRAAAGGAPPTLPGAELQTDGAGWRIILPGALRITLGGCGARLSTLEIRQESGTTDLYTIGAAE